MSSGSMNSTHPPLPVGRSIRSGISAMGSLPVGGLVGEWGDRVLECDHTRTVPGGVPGVGGVRDAVERDVVFNGGVVAFDAGGGERGFEDVDLYGQEAGAGQSVAEDQLELWLRVRVQVGERGFVVDD